MVWIEILYPSTIETLLAKVRAVLTVGYIFSQHIVCIQRPHCDSVSGGNEHLTNNFFKNLADNVFKLIK